MSALSPTMDMLRTFADSTRLRLLCVLEGRELSVAELTTITQLTQSRVSTHLSRLREAGLVLDRRVGTSSLYRLHGSLGGDTRGTTSPDTPMARLWQLLRADLDDSVLASDAERAAEVLQAREGSGRWVERVAGQMERHYSPGRTWESAARGLPGLVRLGSVLDIGAGDGAIAQLIAPRAQHYLCLDCSPTVTSAARRRLQALPSVRYATADMHALPFGAASFDSVVMFNVLTYAAEPVRALAEAARVLRPDGPLALTVLDAHGHREITDTYGHVQAGFSPSVLRELLLQAGLVVERCEVTSRERREPHFQVVTAFARRVATPASRGMAR